MEKLISRKEAAKLLGISIATLDAARKDVYKRQEHEQEILLHQAAKNAFDEMGVKKLPKVKDLQLSLIHIYAYEYTVREDIVMAMEQLELTDAQAQALLDSPTPLADVYRYFEKLETGYMDVDVYKRQPLPLS